MSDGMQQVFCLELPRDPYQECLPLLSQQHQLCTMNKFNIKIYSKFAVVVFCMNNIGDRNEDGCSSKIGRPRHLNRILLHSRPNREDVLINNLMYIYSLS